MTTAFDTDAPLVPLQKQGSGTPYIYFAHPKSDSYGDLCIVLKHKPAEGTPILVTPKDDGEGNISEETYALPGMRFFLVPNMVQHYSTVNDKNEVQHAVFPPNRAPDYEHREHVEGLVFAFYPGGITPARLTFRGPKCMAAHSMSNEAIAAQGAAWAAKSPDHATAVAGIPKAWQRVVGTITLTQETAKKASGNPPQKRQYIIADVNPLPASAADYGMLRAALAEKVTELTLESFNRRITEVRSKG
jgi:hypothetical protein